jgi:hypothetical protein
MCRPLRRKRANRRNVVFPLLDGPTRYSILGPRRSSAPWRRRSTFICSFANGAASMYKAASYIAVFA